MLCCFELNWFLARQRSVTAEQARRSVTFDPEFVKGHRD